MRATGDLVILLGAYGPELVCSYHDPTTNTLCGLRQDSYPPTPIVPY